MADHTPLTACRMCFVGRLICTHTHTTQPHVALLIVAALVS